MFLVNSVVNTATSGAGMVNIRGEESDEDVFNSFTEAEIAEVKEISARPEVYGDLVRPAIMIRVLSSRVLSTPLP
eukprot:3213510-Pyramimonas_sp.AAC.1